MRSALRIVCIIRTPKRSLKHRDGLAGSDRRSWQAGHVGGRADRARDGRGGAVLERAGGIERERKMPTLLYAVLRLLDAASPIRYSFS